MKVSVIVPIYNVEKYLEKCLNSLVNQTLKDIEIICVNDGTKDNSQLIVDKYVKKYDNVKSYIKKNGGLSDARNYGLKYASGEYIAFVDSDDYVDITMYENMYNKAKEQNYDLVVCDTYYVNEYDNILCIVDNKINKDTEDIKRAMLNIYPSAWNKIYRKEIINIKFKKNVWFEDVEFLYRLLPNIKNIGCVNKPFYYYLQRQGSISKSVDKRIYDYVSNLNGLIDYYKKNKIYDEYYKELEYVYIRYLYATFIKAATKYNKKDYIDAYKVAKINQKEHFKHYRKNKYFYKSLKGIYLLLFNRFIANIVYLRSKI